MLPQGLVRPSTLLADVQDPVVDEPHMSHCCLQRVNLGWLGSCRASIQSTNHPSLTVFMYALHVSSQITCAIKLLAADLANMMLSSVVFPQYGLEIFSFLPRCEGTELTLR